MTGIFLICIVLMVGVGVMMTVVNKKSDGKDE